MRTPLSHHYIKRGNKAPTRTLPQPFSLPPFCPHRRLLISSSLCVRLHFPDFYVQGITQDEPFLRSLGAMVLRGMTAAVSLGTAEPVSVSFCLLADSWDVCRFWLSPTKLPWAFRPESPCNVSASLPVHTGAERLNGGQCVPAPTEPITLCPASWRLQSLHVLSWPI